MRRFFARLLNLFYGRAAERELAREIQSHLGLMEEEYERRGLSPEEAKRAARRAYGGVEQAKELHREERSFVWVEQRLKDLRFGGRTLLRNPGFTLVAVSALALGVGANTAIFSVVNAVLLRPLAYEDPDRLVTVLHDGHGPVSPANYIDWRDQSGSYQAIAAAEYWTPNLTGGDRPEHLTGLRVTQNLLPMLGVEPLLGRVFVDGEDLPGADRKVVLSYGLWQRSFSGDPNVIGKPITLDGVGYTVVGVMPSEFQFAPFWATRAEMWAPLAFGDRVHDRAGNSLRLFARLKQGVTLEQARAELAAIAGRLEEQFPGTNRGVVITPLKEKVVGDIETPLLTLMAAVGFVLLIACANVAHMLLARTSERQKEIALRTALGASRTRLIGQFLAENLLLAAIGGAAGFLLALWGTKSLVALSPAYLPRVETVGVDARVVLFLLGITALTAVAFGLTPAMHRPVRNLGGALKEGGRQGNGGVQLSRLRRSLVASEFALAFILLIGAGLMIRSFMHLRSIGPGFNPRNVLSMAVSVAGSNQAEPQRRETFYRQILEQVRALPGVESVGAINHLPLAGDIWGLSFTIEGRPKALPGEAPWAVYRIVMPGYFATMRLPVLRGRDITEWDDARAIGVALINERAAAAYWPGEDPIGKRIAFDADESDPPTWLRIIGVVKNAAQADWAVEPAPEVYLAGLQNRAFLGHVGSRSSYITLVVRTAGNPAGLAPAVMRSVWSLDPDVPVSKVVTMDRVVNDANAQTRFQTLLLGVFAAVALILAAIGIYGVMNYAVSRRTHEIGIRMSLGAGRAEVLRMVAVEGMAPALAGMAAGVAGASALSRLMAGMVYGVRSTDPLTFSGVAIILGLAALAAVFLPAYRASRIEPMAALRNE